MQVVVRGSRLPVLNGQLRVARAEAADGGKGSSQRAVGMGWDGMAPPGQRWCHRDDRAQGASGQRFTTEGLDFGLSCMGLGSVVLVGLFQFRFFCGSRIPGVAEDTGCCQAWRMGG